jgi:DNA processing protein
LLGGALVAVVGTRRASALGLRLCRSLTSMLVQAGVGITSGGALGIDAAAHRAALEGGRATVWVCGTGIDRVYPAAHRSLFEEIAERGVIVSEFSPGRGVKPASFPRRNTTIAGLSRGVLVVEAPARSGALYTAHEAARLGRPVLVAAGPALDRGFDGGHELVEAHKASLVHDARSLLSPLGISDEPTAVALSSPAMTPSREWTPLETAILERLRSRDHNRDELIEGLGNDVAIAGALLTLELEGVIVRGPGERFQVDRERVRAQH